MHYHLKSCVWELTLACCFSCKYCGSRAGKAKDNELSTDECLDIAYQLAGLGCRRVSLIGGEVFMRSDWGEIATALTSKGIKVAIITNGYLFDDNTIRLIKSVGIESIAVSLDSIEDVHDMYRQRGSFRRASVAIDQLSAAKVPVSVISTLNCEGAKRLPKLYKFLKEKDIFAWQIQACSPMGNAIGNVDYRFDHTSVISFVANHMREAPFAMGIADNIGYYTEDEGYLRGNLSGYAFYRGCRAGLSSIGIDSIGNVRGCESLYDVKFIEGNLRERSLREIWNDPDAFRYNRAFEEKMLAGNCSKCKYGAFCRGGCRSYNYFTHGKLYETVFCAR